MEVMTSQELLRQHMTDSAIEQTLHGHNSDRKRKKKKNEKDEYVNCPQCDKQIKSSGLGIHLRTHIEEKPFYCNHCDLQFKTKKYLARHVRNMHSKRELSLKCSYCEKRFRYKASLTKHEMIHTGEKPHKCDVCGKTFRALYSLNTHILIHTDEKPYGCAFCDYCCRDSSTLRKHQERHLGSVERFHCKLCTKAYSKKCKLKVHIAQDHLKLTETKIKCHLCSNEYRDRQTMMAHIKRSHERSSLVQCDVCNRTLDKGNLKAHLRTHCDIRAYKCDFPLCGKRFKTKCDLKKHSVIHNPSDQMVCKECGRVFTRKYRYERHVREGHQPREKTEKCSVCKVMFYTRNHLLKHMHMKHSSTKKQYKCAHCKFSTAIKPSLIGHLKKHEHDFDRQCKICRTTYKRYEYLKSHYLLTHKIRYKPEKFKKIKKISIRPRMLAPNELKALRNKVENPLNLIDVKIEPIDSDENYEDLPLSDLKNQLNSQETESTGTAEPISIDKAKHLLAKRITRSAKEFKKVDGFEEFVDRKIVDKNMDYRTRTTNPGKEINYLKIASEKDVNRLLRNARKRKQIETDDVERKLLDRMTRIYNERLMEAARKGQKTDTKQFKQILKVKIQRDPLMDSYYNENDNNIKRKDNITGNNQNNGNETDTSSVENYKAYRNDIDVTNDAAVANDTFSADNSDKDMIQTNIIVDQSNADDSENINKSSVLENYPNTISNDTFTVQYNNNSKKDKIICQNGGNKSESDVILEKECIKIIKAVSLRLSEDVPTEGSSKNTDIYNSLVKNTDLTLPRNNIDSNANTSYWDISNTNDHRIVQENSVLEINVERRKDKDGPVLNKSSYNEDINKMCNTEAKLNVSNLECVKNKTYNDDTIFIRNDNIEKQSPVSINAGLAFDNGSENFIKEEYSENDITIDNNDLASLKDLEDCILKSENDIQVDEHSLNASAIIPIVEYDKELLQIKKQSANKVLQNDDLSKMHNIMLEDDKMIEEGDKIISEGDDIISESHNKISESDKHKLQVANILSENESRFVELNTPVSQTEHHNLEIKSLNLNTHKTDLHNNNLENTQHLENNIEGLNNNESDSDKGCLNTENEGRELEIESPLSENKSHDPDNEINDTENDNHDSDTCNEDTNIPSTSNTKPTDGIKKYKKLNSKKIKFNTSQCYVCFKLFQTKEELLEHCKQHFDICNESRLKKCPLCNFVGRNYLRKHLLTKHNINIDQGKYNTIETNNAGTYTIKVAQKPTKNTTDVKNIEIIPSVKQLNKQAYIKIDEKNRLNKKSNIVKRKLVKKGSEWIVETENVKLNYLNYLLPLGKDVKDSVTTELDNFDYLEQLTKLSINAKKEDRTILYPCDRCELICTNMAALKAHRKSHDKIKTGKRKPKKTTKEKPRKIDKKDLKNTDPKLLEFFEQNVKGVGFDDFEQFSEIYRVIDNLSDDKLALAATNKEYGLLNLADRPNGSLVNLEENATNNRVKKRYNFKRNSAYKEVVKICGQVKRKAEKAKLRKKINRNKV